jgi:hypothetical protein
VVFELDQEYEDIEELLKAISKKLGGVSTYQHEVLTFLVNEENEQFVSLPRWSKELGESLFTGVLPLEQPEATKCGERMCHAI